MSDDFEIPLDGGAFSNVVRIGATVRRDRRPRSSLIQELLRHLEASGFEGAPRALGFDEKGREVLSYVEGEVGVGLPSYVWEEHVLVELGQLLRRLHDAASTFPLIRSSAWGKESSFPIETICHDDVVPWNTVFRDGVPIALIDWDHAAPGSRVYCLAYAAASYVPLGDEERCRQLGSPQGLDIQRHRLRLFLDSYGVECDPSLFEALLRRYHSMKISIPRLANQGVESMQTFLREGGLAEIDRTISWLNAEGQALLP